MPMKYLSVLHIIIILFYAGILRLPAAIAEEPTDNTQPIKRNPFVNAPHGRMSKTPPGTGPNAYSGSINKDSVDARLMGLSLRGVLISNDKAAALLNHKIVGIGDMIGEYTVTEISDNGVTLSKGDLVIRLNID